MRHLLSTPHRCWLILVLVSFAVMSGVLRCGITSWDDQATLYRPAFHPPTGHSLGEFWYTPFMHTYMPLTQSLWWVAAVVSNAVSTPGEFAAYPFHLLNLIGHMLAVVCAFNALRLLVGSDRAAFGGALVVAVHPTQVESVAWISALNVILAGLFTFLSIWQYVLFARAERSPRRGLHWALALIAFILGLLSKPTTVAVPAILLVIDRMVLRRSWKNIATSLAAFVILAVVCAIWTARVQTAAVVATVVSWPWRPLVALDAIQFYLYKLVAPLRLAIDYGRTPQYVVRHPYWFALAIIPVAIALWLLKNHRKQVLLAAAGAIFVVSLLPVLGLVPFDFQQKSTVADRYLYLPMFGVALAIAWAIQRFKVSNVVYLLAGLWGLLSCLQVQTWRDSIVLYRQQISVRPGVWVGHGNLAIELAQLGQYAEAEAEFNRAEQLDPNLEVLHNHAKLLEEMNRYPEAARYYWRTIQVAPGISSSWSNFARMLAAAGQVEDAKKAYARALELDPQNAEARDALK